MLLITLVSFNVIKGEIMAAPTSELDEMIKQQTTLEQIRQAFIKEQELEQQVASNPILFSFLASKLPKLNLDDHSDLANWKRAREYSRKFDPATFTKMTEMETQFTIDPSATRFGEYLRIMGPK
jgi:hypothetical protein